jgi:molybdate transport system substrate-binding protein
VPAVALARLALVAVLACGGIAGCGSGSGGRPTLVVSAAASLTRALSRYAHEFPPARVRLSFAGSDALAAQIRQGVRPDVFAAANTTLPDALYAQGLVERPVVFAANKLVLAVPAGSRTVRGVADLARPGVTVAIGAAGVPVGSYTLAVLGRLAPAQKAAILADVRTEEPDVTGIVGKLVNGAVDAGFLYATDVTAAHGRLRAIELPARLLPQVAYGAAVVRGASHPAQARAFVSGLVHGAGARELLAAGFLPAPENRRSPLGAKP